MASYSRTQRIAEEIRKVISTMLISGIKDYRINSMVSVTDVEVTSDLSYAKVYVSFLNKNTKKSMEALERSKGYIRSLLAKRITIRKCPELQFVLDTSLAYGNKIETIISEINKH